MNLSRFSVKCLAWVVGFFGAAFAVAGLLMLVSATYGKPPERVNEAMKSAMIAVCAAYALTAILGYLVARQAWKHLRQPDLATANNIVGLASLLLAIEVFQLGIRYSFLPKPGGIWDHGIEWLFGLTVIVAVTLFYRLVLKRLAARAFPPDAAGPASAV
jgi:NAD/NADP transhydrogenase beta subunit